METPAALDAELLSRTLQVEQKLFYLDLKDNPRGRYLKISEKTSGSRSTIIVPHAGIVWFVDLFSYYSTGNDVELASKELQLDSKVFYFDVGANHRGRFLKVSEASMTRNRSTIIVPAGATGDEGWAAFRNVLVEIHEATQQLPLPLVGLQSGQTLPNETNGFLSTQSQLPLSVPGGTEKGVKSALPDTQDFTLAKQLRAEQKKFFFDLGTNARGQYLKISEVTGVERSSVILPTSALEQFHSTIGYFLETVRSQIGAGTGSTANVRTIAPLKRRGDN